MRMRVFNNDFQIPRLRGLNAWITSILCKVCEGVKPGTNYLFGKQIESDFSVPLLPENYTHKDENLCQQLGSPSLCFGT